MPQCTSEKLVYTRLQSVGVLVCDTTHTRKDDVEMMEARLKNNGPKTFVLFLVSNRI